MKDLENSTNQQVGQIIEIETGIGLETVLNTLNIETEDKQGDQILRIDLEKNLDSIWVIDPLIEKEKLRRNLDRNQRNIVNIVTRVIILGNIAGRCKPM